MGEGEVERAGNTDPHLLSTVLFDYLHSDDNSPILGSQLVGRIDSVTLWCWDGCGGEKRGEGEKGWVSTCCSLTRCYVLFIFAAGPKTPLEQRKSRYTLLFGSEFQQHRIIHN